MQQYKSWPYCADHRSTGNARCVFVMLPQGKMNAVAISEDFFQLTVPRCLVAHHAFRDGRVLSPARRDHKAAHP